MKNVELSTVELNIIKHGVRELIGVNKEKIVKANVEGDLSKAHEIVKDLQANRKLYYKVRSLLNSNYQKEGVTNE